jgi:folate-binding protein YgfZ
MSDPGAADADPNRIRSMSLAADYAALREHAAVGATSPRSQLAVAGQDRASFLQGLLTNDIQALVPGTGCYAAWLTPQGRMLTDMHVLQSETMILLDVPAGLAAPTLERLDQFLFSEDVQLASLADTITGVWVHGPAAHAALQRTVGGLDGADGWEQYRHGRFTFDGTSVSVVRIDQLGVPGYCVYLERARAADLQAALQSAGPTAASNGALTAVRIEAGYPLFGSDMTDSTIPLEAGIEQRAISFTKGCYVGQEVIIRVLHRGGGRVAKKLVALRIDGPVPEPGATLVAGDREVGQVTSAADSPRVGSIALGYVHRDFVAAGTTLSVHGAPAVVTTTPIP